MPLVTLVMKYLQYCGALTQPSVSTHSMVTLVLPAAWSASWTALAAPRPTLPATGKMMSAPSLMKVWVSVWPLVWLVKSPVNEPFWVCSFQPSTVTCVSCLAVVVLHAVPVAVHVDGHGRQSSTPPNVATLPVLVMPAAR